MILLRKYGMLLSQVQPENLEMIRQWRNKEAVRTKMQHTELITETQQKAWYNQINENQDLYFVYDNIGVVNLKDIEWETQIAEVGIFSSQSDIHASLQSIKAVLILMDFAFGALGLKSLKATIKDDNETIIHLNLALGYQLQTRGKGGFSQYGCSVESYMQSSERWHLHFKKLYKEDSVLKVQYTEDAPIAHRLTRIEGFLFLAQPFSPL